MQDLVRLLPAEYRQFVEPMAGGAALFFSAQPRRAVLADSNNHLINFYHVLAHRTDELVNRLLVLKASRSLYYKFRGSKPRGNMNRAVRFAYLNRLCWNGVYRVNRKGEFNVPIGSRLPAKLWDEWHLRQAATLLQNATLACADFEDTLQSCQPGDVVYLDPPYPKGNKNGIGFNRYTSAPFGFTDHERLANRTKELDKRGVFVIVSTGASKDFVSLFPKSFRALRIRSSSLIACTGHARGRLSEIVLTNF